MGEKIWSFAQRCIICCGIVLVIGLVVWGGIIIYDSHQQHGYPIAFMLRDILELQTLALSEDVNGEQAFFISYIGSAAPAIWHQPQVLDNLKSMVEQGIEVKLIGSRSKPDGTDCSGQFIAKLLEYGIDPDIYAIAELWNSYFTVAGSGRRAVTYGPQADIHPPYNVTFIKVNDMELCQESKKYFRDAFIAAKEGQVKQPD